MLESSLETAGAAVPLPLGSSPPASEAARQHRFLFSHCSCLQQKLLIVELKDGCFKKCLSLRSHFLISSSQDLHVRCLESNRTGFFLLSVGLV